MAGLRVLAAAMAAGAAAARADLMALVEADCASVRADCARSCAGAEPTVNSCELSDMGFTSECACSGVFEGGEATSAIFGDLMQMSQMFAADPARALPISFPMPVTFGDLDRMDRVDMDAPPRLVSASGGSLPLFLRAWVDPVVQVFPISYFDASQDDQYDDTVYNEPGGYPGVYPYSYDVNGQWVSLADFVGAAYSYLYDSWPSDSYSYAADGGSYYSEGEEAVSPCEHAMMDMMADPVRREAAMMEARQEMLSQQPALKGPRDLGRQAEPEPAAGAFPEDDADSRPPRPRPLPGLRPGQQPPPPPPPGAVLLAAALVAGTLATVVSMCTMCARAARRAEAAQQLVDVAQATPLLTDDGAAVVVNPVHRPAAYEPPASIVYVTVDADTAAAAAAAAAQPQQ